jgi:hypothetical protein
MICIYYVLCTYKEGRIAKKNATHKNMTSIKYMCAYKKKRKYHYKRSDFDFDFSRSYRSI